MKIAFNVIFLLTLVLLFPNCEKESGGEPVVPQITITDVSSPEGNGMTTFQFKVNLSEETSQEVSVSFKTVDYTAIAGEDYTEKNGVLVFAPKETEHIVEVQVLGDEIKESGEKFEVVLFDPVNAQLGSLSGDGNIQDDDTSVFIPADGFSTPENYLGWDKVWADEFDGSMLDEDSWTYEVGGEGWGNNEWQYYREGTNNAYLSDGNLTIEAKKESFETAQYTSARLITKGKKEFTLGRVDIRAKLPEGQGIWPALWMLGANISEVGWPACGEIDVMELLGHEPSTSHATVHWGNPGEGSQHTGGSITLQDNEKFSDNFHVFSLIWKVNQIEAYVDYKLIRRWKNSEINGNYPFNTPFFFIFNIAVGGNWPGYPDETTQFPQYMHVDYIRYFQRN
ncbi:MAG: family 16 glycosylhydrolase [Bacteroidetes bacterium]|nr:family 16 glycosylhydrolase [Bacteroidota bacterium]